MIRKLFLVSVLAFTGGYVAFHAGGTAADAIAQPVALDAAPPTDPAPAPVEEVAAAGPSADVSTAPEPTVEQRLAEALELLQAYRAAAEGDAKKLARFALIAGIGWLLIAVLKAITPLGGDTGKRYIPLVVLGLGAGVALCASLAAGQAWAAALFYGAGPPLAVFVQELIKVFTKKAAPAT